MTSSNRRHLPFAATIFLILFSVLLLAQSDRVQVTITLTPLVELGRHAEGSALNDVGQIVGSYFRFTGKSGQGTQGSFFWSPPNRIIELGTLPGDYGSYPSDLNDSGQVVGISYYGRSYHHPFLWSAESGMINLGSLGGVSTSASYINNRGEVVGTGETVSGELHYFYWSADIGIVDLGRRAYGPLSINDAGRVLLQSASDGRFYFWSRADGMIALDIPTGSTPRALNNQSHILGDSPQGAFIWTPESGVVHFPGQLGASAFNDRDEVVGSYASPDGRLRAFYWSVDEGVLDMGEIEQPDPPVAYSPRAINNLGQAVGTYRFQYRGHRSFFWSKATGMVDIGALAQGDSHARAISNSGYILGSTGWNPSDEYAYEWVALWRLLPPAR